MSFMSLLRESWTPVLCTSHVTQNYLFWKGPNPSSEFTDKLHRFQTSDTKSFFAKCWTSEVPHDQNLSSIGERYRQWPTLILEMASQVWLES